MPDTLPGSTYTFTVLFVDADGDPIAGITDATIDIFRVDETGTKITLGGGPMAPVLPAETGRFVYPFYGDPSVLCIGDTFYGEFSGTDPAHGTVTLRTEEPVDVVGTSAAGGVGLISRFVKGG